MSGAQLGVGPRQPRAQLGQRPPLDREVLVELAAANQRLVSGLHGHLRGRQPVPRGDGPNQDPARQRPTMLPIAQTSSIETSSSSGTSTANRVTQAVRRGPKSAEIGMQLAQPMQDIQPRIRSPSGEQSRVVVEHRSVGLARGHLARLCIHAAARRRSPSRRHRYARRRWSSTWRPAGGPPRSARRTARRGPGYAPGGVGATGRAPCKGNVGKALAAWLTVEDMRGQAWPARLSLRTVHQLNLISPLPARVPLTVDAFIALP